jgi:acyl-CoA thioesterase II
VTPLPDQDLAAATRVGPHPWWVPTLFDATELRAALDVATSADRPETEVAVLRSGHGGVLGAQLLAQQVIAAESCLPGYRVHSMGLSFVGASSCLEPLSVSVAPLSAGRTVAHTSVTFIQAGKVVAQGPVQLEPDLEASPGRIPAGVSGDAAVDGPDLGTLERRALWPWPATAQTISSDGTLIQWARIDELASPREGRALIAFATESLTIPLAIDVRGDRAFGGRLRQAVTSHHVTFLASLEADRWHRHEVSVVDAEPPLVVGSGRVLDTMGRLAVLTRTSAVVDKTNVCLTI